VGARIGIAGRRRALSLSIALIAAGALMLTATSAHAASGVTATLPATYLKNYGQRAKKCADLVTPPWVRWLSYANAVVSDQWVVYASTTGLCNKARATSDAVITDAPDSDGALQNLSAMIDYARSHHQPFTEPAPRPAGRGWKCTLLPSFWGELAWQLQHGSPSDSALASASGAAAGAGFCVAGAAKKAGQYQGGQFFTWAPNTVACSARYKLKTIPDPLHPHERTNPPFPANLWGDYKRLTC
jgi:hypothetical protein